MPKVIERGFGNPNKGADEQAALAREAAAEARKPRRTQYGSYVGPLSGFAPQQSQQPQQQLGGIGGMMQQFFTPQNGGGGVPDERFTFIDPSIRSMREQSLANIPTYQNVLAGQYGTTMAGLGQSRSRLEDLYGQTNDNAFMDPLLQRLALARGELTRGLVNRGLGGSSFQGAALGNFESAAAPGIAEARQQGISARQGLLGQIGQFDSEALGATAQTAAQLQNLDNLYASVAGQNLQQELAALGLSQADIGAILGAGQQLGESSRTKGEFVGRVLGGIGSMIPG